MIKHFVQYLISKYNWMCDLHRQRMEIDNLAICFCMLCVYLCSLCRYNAAIKSRLAPGCSRQPGCPWGHQIGDMRLTGCVSYWFHSGPSQQSNRRCDTLKYVSYSFVMGDTWPLVCLLLVPQWPQLAIKSVTCTFIARLRLISNGRPALPMARLRCILTEDAFGCTSQTTL
jgi:hypothetical protein